MPCHRSGELAAGLDPTACHPLLPCSIANISIAKHKERDESVCLTAHLLAAMAAANLRQALYTATKSLYSIAVG